MNVNDFYSSRYLKSSDLSGSTHVVQISRIEVETLGDPQNPDRKPVIYFAGKDKGLVLNKTNALVIAAKFGPEMNSWIAKQIELFSMPVQGPNGTVDGIRLRPMEQEPRTAQVQF
jgi:hypothetical protein